MNVGLRMASVSAATVKAIKRPGLHGDGNGLYLRVTGSGSRSWMQRNVIHGHRRDLGLGSYPAIGLAQARALANKTLVIAGRDPLAERRRATIPTFREAAKKVYEANLPRWRNGKHTVNWWGSLELHAFPVIGEVKVGRIRRSVLLAVLEPIWAVQPETARRVRQRIRTILRWCEAHDYCAGNATGEALNGALPSMPRLKAHHRALPYREVAEALETVDGSEASLVAKLCLRFLVLTAARSGEARGSSLGRDRRGRTGVAHPGGADEGRSPAPRTAVQSCVGGVGTGKSASRRLRSGLSIACEAGPSHVGHDADQGAAGNRPCRARHRARVSFYIPGLGGRMHQCASRSHGVELGARGGIVGGASLCAFGSHRETARALGPMGALRERRGHRLSIATAFDCECW